MCGARTVDEFAGPPVRTYTLSKALMELVVIKIMLILINGFIRG